jgi:GT2 family glycosyltransferase
VVDQTRTHEPDAQSRLQELEASGAIRWLRLEQPSIPAAMNCALIAARHDIILFLDDDIRPEPGLVAAHHGAHQAQSDVLVAGKVIQPWDEGRDYSADMHFHFATDSSRWVREFMGGNFSIRRSTALALHGFDENFVRVAYRFEAEFAHRLLASGRRIYYDPAACLHHLKASLGGTRTYGEHLTTWRPDHAVGAYYFALRTHNLRDFVKRPLRSVATRYHLRHPWRVPPTLLAELRGMAWALALYARGPRHLQPVSENNRK